MQKNQVIFLMVIDKAKKCYYFDVKNLLELYSSKWLRSKKATIINNDNFFQNALKDALKYQNIENKPQRILKIKPYFSKYNWEGIEFPAGTEEWGKFEKNNKTIALAICAIKYKNDSCCIQIEIYPKA